MELGFENLIDLHGVRASSGGGGLLLLQLQPDLPVESGDELLHAAVEFLVRQLRVLALLFILLLCRLNLSSLGEDGRRRHAP